MACVTTMVCPPTVPTELAGAATVTVFSMGPFDMEALGLVTMVGAAGLVTMVVVGTVVLVTKVVGLVVVKIGVAVPVADAKVLVFTT